MELEHDNLRAALEWSASNDLAKAIDLALALDNFWTSRDYNSEAVAWCQTILARAESRPDLAATRAELYADLGWSAIFSGNHKLARAAGEAGLSWPHRPLTKQRLCTCNQLSLLSAMYLADFPAAQQALQTSEALARELGCTDELAMILVLGGQIQFFAGGDIAQARANLAEAESLAINAGSKWATAAFIFGFARLAGMLGDVDKARSTIQAKRGSCAKKWATCALCIPAIANWRTFCAGMARSMRRWNSTKVSCPNGKNSVIARRWRTNWNASPSFSAKKISPIER